MLTVRDGDGEVLRTVRATTPEGMPAESVPLVVRPGLNLYAWDLRTTSVAGIASPDGSRSWALAGPRVVPGAYTVTLDVGPVTASAQVEVARDPRHYTDDADLAAQYAYLVAVRDLVERIVRGVESSRGVREALAAWASREVPVEVAAAATDLAERLMVVERRLNNPDLQGHGDQLKMPAGLDEKLILLPQIVVELSDTRPTDGAEQVRQVLTERAEAALAELTALLAGPLDEVEGALRSAEVPLIPRAPGAPFRG